MGRLAAGVLLGALLAPLLLAAAAYLYVAWWLERAPSVAEGSTLVLPLKGTIAERPSAGTLTTVEIWQVLRHAASDSRISRLVIQPDGPGAGWAKLAEIRGGILNFRKSGKPVHATLRTPGMRDYYLASAANRISLPPSDLVDVKGLRVELLYGRGLLDKLGILPEFEAVGKYKDGADALTRSSMSEVTRETVNELLDARMAGFVEAVSSGRGKTAAEVRAWIDDGPVMAPGARERGMVDALEFENQTLGGASGETKTPRIDAQDYIRAARGGGARVAVLGMAGDIVRANWSWLSGEALTPEDYTATIRALKDDASVRGVILRVDSPGGDAIASDEILHELKQLAAKKTLVVSMADVAASGGYTISLAGGPIVAYPETVTGSIGVFYGKLSLQGLYDKAGIRNEVLTRGKFADIDSESRPLSGEARAKLRSTVEQSYRQFVGQVAAARKRSPEAIDKVAQGRVWLAPKAKEHGLVDELGGIEKAIEILRRDARIVGPIRLDLYPKATQWQEWLQWFDKLRKAQEQVRHLTWSHTPALWKRAIRIPEELR
ncbi:MAG: signal peptide peptidase SppA [Bryobacterales bacterium]|nr:signal peptide peptidase SppA [Bryobacterales bacterium]